VHGTVGIEASILGIPVICADKSYYSDWPFVYTATSQSDYISKLLNLHHYTFKSMDELNLADQAAACSYAALSSNMSQDYTIFKCDSLQNCLYPQLVYLLLFEQNSLIKEISSLRAWHDQSIHSYHVFKALMKTSAI
jgi:hypothetical protein